jgi:hypothetical protein
MNKLGLSILGIAIVVGAFIGVIVPIPMKSVVVQEVPKQYPSFDQTKMNLTLKTDEVFISIQNSGAGFFTLTTLKREPQPSGANEFRVYTLEIGDRGTVINPPSLWFTIRDQR